MNFTAIARSMAPLVLTTSLALAAMPAGAQVTIPFTESIGNSLETVTGPISSSDAGVAGAEFIVTKTITNASNASWHDLHVHLETLIDGQWVPSPESDGISFDQAFKTPAQWAAATAISVNGVAQSGYTATRDLEFPSDTADFFFNDLFKVNPGDVLQLTFYMSDNDTNTWRLRQVASVPEPGTLGLLGLAVAGLAGLRRRKVV